MGNSYTPTKKDRFTFGLWTVGNVGRDPFGEAVRKPVSPPQIVARLSALGAYGVNLHDNDLVPFASTPAERDRIVKEFKGALADHGMVVPMATTNLFSHAIFKDGAFTANDPEVRAFALHKTMRAMDLGAELGARIYVFWGGREGTEVDAAKDGQEAIKRFREALNYLCEYSIAQGYGMKFALEAKPNEPRGHIYFATTGSYLAFIETLDHPEMVGVNPEVAHEHMSGLNFAHQVAQALEAGKLFHIDLNDQNPGRYDQDFRFAAENYKSAFFLVKVLEDGGYTGPLHFDAHAYRTEDEEGVWDFAAGCMRSYLVLKAKVARFNADPEIQGLLREIGGRTSEKAALVAEFSPERAQQLKAASFDVAALAGRGLKYEKLDQLVFDLLMGVR